MCVFHKPPPVHVSSDWNEATIDASKFQEYLQGLAHDYTQQIPPVPVVSVHGHNYDAGNQEMSVCVCVSCLRGGHPSPSW